MEKIHELLNWRFSRGNFLREHLALVLAIMKLKHICQNCCHAKFGGTYALSTYGCMYSSYFKVTNLWYKLPTT